MRSSAHITAAFILLFHAATIQLAPAAEEPLLQAAGLGDWDSVARLIESGADPNTVDAEGKTALWHACDRKSRGGVLLLLKNKVTIRTESLVRPTPEAESALPAIEPLGAFHNLRIEGPRLEFWTSILNPEVFDFDPRSISTSLRKALPEIGEEAARLQLPLLELLLDQGADPDVLCRGLTPLGSAACLSNTDALQLLLKHGAAVEGAAGQLLSPLALAVIYERLPNVEALVKAGASPELPITKGIDPDFTPLFLAGFVGNREIFEALIRPIRESKDPVRLTKTLGVACATGNVAAVRSLIQVGARGDSVLPAGQTPLHIAASHPNVEILTLLLKDIAHPDLKDTAGYTPLHNSCEHSGTAAVIKLLLERGANLEARTNDGYTPLLVAAEHSEAENVQCLLEAGADSAVRSPKGFSALYCAANNRDLDPEMFEILIAAGVEVDGASRRGSTPLYVLSGGGAGHRASTRMLAPSLGRIQLLHERLRPIPHEKEFVICLKLLLKHGATPDLPELAPVLPVNIAVMGGYPLILQALIDGGAELDFPPGECSPMHMAAFTGNLACAELLLKAGTPLDRPVHNGMTPREAAAKAKANKEAIIKLFDAHPRR